VAAHVASGATGGQGGGRPKRAAVFVAQIERFAAAVAERGVFQPAVWCFAARLIWAVLKS